MIPGGSRPGTAENNNMQRLQRLQLALAIALCSLGLAAAPAQAHSPEEHAGHQGHAGHAGHAAAPTRPEGTRVRFADVLLTDQHERQVRLGDEVVDDRIVVMGFVYTSCTTVCPVVSAIMQKVQMQLGERAGREVQLVSISVDPLRDTPARLREYASLYKAGPGWTWLTGPVPAVNDTLKGLGTWSADFENHTPVILVGDARSGQWTRFYGFTDPAVLLAKVEELSAQRQDHEGHEGHQSFMVKGERP